ncbi:ATP synthase F1 subunit gamma [Weeksellaceae bacterium KMM 9713]|uniref:ATP synthase gamma chain n=1 Tax=Profundicola chukchiensis TaxID=2961959 RepID=A0A9X4RU11_9FLAO|nr:ATP synthase F1 subunit gamma [Profundicola chukchiensis]MDG4945211.1 ATP synthase F1 subunit gamma [Profundicola chukchiensis]MDG4950285.1 ATP synthase F1 subunit gamma [Profundicola chukchiensis]
MANLKEIRSRITSVGSTMQITNAMKMVSAAKLKKAQDAIIQMRPYANKLRELMDNVSASMDEEVGGDFTEKREVRNVLIIAVTSNRGLAGAFNSNVIKEVVRLAKEDYKGKNVSYLTIGKKANDIVKKEHTVYKNESHLWDDFNFKNSSDIADQVMEAFKNKEFDEVRLVYNHFKNAANQDVLNEAFLPISIDTNQEVETSVDYIFEPNKVEILMELIPKTLKTQLYKALLDSNASEHGARMTAMHKATDNAAELEKALKLQYNKARQAAITNEILEIVGGADALDG